jgi:uncharacterized protein (TIGR02271 family)
LAYLVVRRGWTNELVSVTPDAIEEITSSGAIHLRVSKEEAHRGSAEVPREALVATADRGEIHVPIVEEHLVPDKRMADLGELRVHKRVDTREEVIRQALTRDDLLVERVPVNQPLEAPVSPRMEDDWYVIPVMEEVLVVQKRLVLKEEIRIRKRQVEEMRETHETVRYERLEMEDATVHGVRGLDAALSDRVTASRVVMPDRADGSGPVLVPVARRGGPAYARPSERVPMPRVLPGDGLGEERVHPVVEPPSEVPQERVAPNAPDDVTRPIATDRGQVTRRRAGRRA